jgi:hypothetical protein
MTHIRETGHKMGELTSAISNRDEIKSLIEKIIKTTRDIILEISSSSDECIKILKQMNLGPNCSKLEIDNSRFREISDNTKNIFFEMITNAQNLAEEFKLEESKNSQFFTSIGQTISRETISKSK